MPISLAQLETWSHQGSITQSSSSYATIRRALQSPLAGYADQAATIQAQISPATYDHTRFKDDVLSALRSSFGNAIRPGSKAIPVPAGAGRRDADVIVAVQQRRYFPTQGLFPGSTHTDGIAFQKSSGA
jgi:phage gp45-like